MVSYQNHRAYIQMRKTIHSAFTERMVFLLVEVLPQTPVNAVLRAAAARFWESLYLITAHFGRSRFSLLSLEKRTIIAREQGKEGGRCDEYRILEKSCPAWSALRICVCCCSHRDWLAVPAVAVPGDQYRGGVYSLGGSDGPVYRRVFLGHSVHGSVHLCLQRLLYGALFYAVRG